MRDLIERLRFRHAKGHKGLEETMQEAATALEQQAGEIERQSNRAESFAADCLRIRVAMGLGLHSTDDLVEVAARLKAENAELRKLLREWVDHGHSRDRESRTLAAVDAAMGGGRNEPARTA